MFRCAQNGDGHKYFSMDILYGTFIPFKNINVKTTLIQKADFWKTVKCFQ